MQALTLKSNSVARPITDIENDCYGLTLKTVTAWFKKPAVNQQTIQNKKGFPEDANHMHNE